MLKGNISSYKKITFSAVIIGAGRIGCFYDRPEDSRRCSTHAHAYYNSERISLDGICDIDKNKALKAAKIWKTKAYGSSREMLSEIKPNIVSIAVPTEYHYRVFKEVLNYKPELIFMEKPLAANLKDSVRMVKEAERRPVILVVNYQRQWMREIIELQKKYKSGKFGNFISGVVYYNKGFRRNGSHLLHLMISLLGDVVKAKILGKKIDYSRKDPTLDIVIEFRNGRVYFVGLDKKCYGISEIDLFFERGRVAFQDFGRGIINYDVGYDSYYPEEKVLRPRNSARTSLSLLEDVAANLVEVLENKARPLVSGRDALDTEKALTKIIDKIK